MATQNSTLSSPPAFPQVFTPAIAQAFAQSIDRLISRIQKGFPSTCEYDHYLCGAESVVSDLESERNYCAKHFREVNRG